MNSLKNLLTIFTVLFFASCGEKFLDTKPVQSQRVPVTVADFQALLDNTNTMNGISSHILGYLGADEYLLPDARYASFPAGVAYNYQKRAITWERIIYEGGETLSDWHTGYARILQANVVIDGLRKISPAAAEKTGWENAMGSALFFRALNFYTLAQIYCAPYDQSPAKETMGLPLPLEPDVTLKLTRASLEETYARIVNDLEEALPLLPDAPLVVFRPSKPAAYMLLARTHMQTGDYQRALEFSGKCLDMKKVLMDFNEMDLSKSYIFPAYGEGNPEMIFYSYAANVIPVTTSFLNVNPELLDLYQEDDLRRTGYFTTYTDGRVLFKGSYEGSPGCFTGFATDEAYLTRAECYARTGDLAKALEDLNFFRRHRYDKDRFVLIEGSTVEEVLTAIVTERRKEMVLRGTRWEDLRRLNKDSRFAVTLTRELLGVRYELPSGDPRYTWPLPEEAIDIGGYEQNLR